MDVHEAAQVTSAALEGAGIQASSAVQLYIAQVVMDAYEAGQRDVLTALQAMARDGEVSLNV